MTWPNLSARGYQAATYLIPLLAGPALALRLARGKETVNRVQEKRGIATVPRPKGRLVWLHGVGLGEVLALRGLIAKMQEIDPRLHFLITSSTSQSAAAIAAQMPTKTRHQFLPLDAPAYRRRFLDHWQPDLAVWTDQDLWPGLVADCTARGIPVTIAAGRMDAQSFAKRARGRGIYRAALGQMALVSAQDQASAAHLTQLGARKVRVDGSLKPAAPPLACDPNDLRAGQTIIGNRLTWCVCPSHPADEHLALAAHQVLLRDDPTALLIIAPRHPNRQMVLPFAYAKRSVDTWPGPDQPLMLWDSLGETGLLYRLCNAAYIGGTNDATEGHNPWEALHLGVAITHGPRTGNFAPDYAALAQAGLAQVLTNAPALAHQIRVPPTDATAFIHAAQTSVRTLAQDLLKTAYGR